MTEHYTDRLQKEIDEIKKAHPKIEKIINTVIQIYKRSNFDYDYTIQRTHDLFTSVNQILKEP